MQLELPIFYSGSMQKFWAVLFSFLVLPTLHANPLDEAGAYFEATLYQAAIEKYRPLLKSHHLKPSELAEVQERLAQAYLYEKDPKAALEALNEFPPSLEGIYLKGIALKLLGQAAEAERAFETSAATPNQRQQEASLELGINRFDQQRGIEETRAPFEEVKQVSGKEELFHQAQIYLARLDLRGGNCDKAVKRLRNLQMSLPSGSLYNIQAAFWMGMAFYQKGNLPEALQAFAASLPKKGSSPLPWQSETLRYMVDCTLELAKSQGHPAFYNQAEELLRASEPSEEGDLALAELLLFRGKQFNDAASFQKGRSLLEEPGKFTSLAQRGRVCAALAQVTEGAERGKYLAEMTQDAFKNTTAYAKGWLWRGEDLLREGIVLKKKGDGAAGDAFQGAAEAFDKCGPSARLLQAEALWRLKTPASLAKALQLIDQERPDGETYYFKGLVAADLDRKIGIAALKEGLKNTDGEEAEKIQLLLATLYFHDQNLQAAFENFISLSEKSRDPETASRALLWAARCIEAQPDEARSLRRKVFETYPNTPAAAEGYFLFYPYRDYLQGDRSALKHLQAFKEKFPDSPLRIVAQYLVGMDFKRDRKTVEGKWIRKKDLNSSIEAFQEGETLFEELVKGGAIPEEELPFYEKVKLRATLERALSNLAIADESQGAKRQIFLEYAEEVFRSIGENFVTVQEGYPPLLEESSYWLIQTLLKQGQKEEAEKELEGMIARYKQANITRGYFLSRVWYEKGQLAMAAHQPLAALEDFSFAEEAGKGKILSTDQRIDLLIQKSLCFQALNDTDKAMLLLSQAINSDEVSSLRIKAMYLRAEIYQQQGRKELARKQLEATSKKGGEWALKAKQKLDEEL